MVTNKICDVTNTDNCVTMVEPDLKFGYGPSSALGNGTYGGFIGFLNDQNVLCAAGILGEQFSLEKPIISVTYSNMGVLSPSLIQASSSATGITQIGYYLATKSSVNRIACLKDLSGATLLKKESFTGTMSSDPVTVSVPTSGSLSPSGGGSKKLLYITIGGVAILILLVILFMARKKMMK